MNRFFVDFDGREFDKSIDITGEDVNHIKNVLRLKVNDEIIISDGRGRDYRCQISVMDHEKVVADILDVCDNFAELETGITLFQGFPKADKMEWIIQKTVELGVTRIVPVMTEVTAPVTWKEALAMAKELDMNMIPYEEAEGVAYSKEVFASIKGKKSLGIFIGPEGGFAREEVETAVAMGAKMVTLGHRILRTETAGMAVMSIIMFELEEDR